MSKEDKGLSEEYENVLKELEAAKAELAATAVLQQKAKLPKLSWIVKPFLKLFAVKKLLIGLLFIIIIAGFWLWLYTGSTFKKESTTFVEQVQELATLATAQAHVKVIIELEDNKLFGKDINVNFPGTKRELLLVVPATVIAGVDLKSITLEDIKIDDKEKQMDISLPHATFIQDPAIQMDKVSTFSNEGLFRGETNWDEGFDLAAEAQEQIKAETIDIGLLQTAEKNAEKVLKEFFTNLGYTVEISFK